MPTKTLSPLDYIFIAEERLRGQSQKQVADLFNVSLSLISKIEQSNRQYRQIQRDLQASVIDERARLLAHGPETKKAEEAAERALAHAPNSTTGEKINKEEEAAERAFAHAPNSTTGEKINKEEEAAERALANGTRTSEMRDEASRDHFRRRRKRPDWNDSTE